MPTVVRPVLASIKILAVDDHADTRKMLKMFLEWSGADVTTADSALSALDELQKQKPDVLLCDLSMPHMDGFELLRRVRGLGREVASVPAIACTAFGSKKT
jgi:CheY-like chemotaxis protein